MSMSDDPSLVPADRRVALLTGAGSGLGAVMAQALAGAGFRVVVADIDYALAGEVAAALRRRGGQALAHRCDVANDEQVQALIERTRREFGGLDVLVNTAGPVPVEPVMSHWARVIGTNLVGCLLVTRHALDLLRERQGVIINIAASEALGTAPSEQPVFAAAKAGVLRFSSAFAGQAAALGVDVHCLVPDAAAVAEADALSRRVVELATRERGGPALRLLCRGPHIEALPPALP